jgi:hypothetical protein
VFFGGKNVVSLWWIRGEMWCFGWCFLTAKNLPTFLALFLGVPVLGIAARQIVSGDDPEKQRQRQGRSRSSACGEG